MRAAVFLDRDGVLVADVGHVSRAEQLHLLPGVGPALRRLADAGFRLVVVSNQAVVARGLATEHEVGVIHAALQDMLIRAGAPPLQGWYFCPHHPEATLTAYRLVCDCRKPRAGLLLRAARELDLNLSESFLVGDRLTDIHAGAQAGCRTVLVETGAHAEPLIRTAEPLDPSVRPERVCADLAAAADWILGERLSPRPKSGNLRSRP